MKKSTTYVLILTAVLLAAACQKIAIANYTRPMQVGKIRYAVSSSDTKGLVDTLESLQAGGFYLTAYLDDPYFKDGDDHDPSGEAGPYIGSVASPATASYTDPTWSISGDPKWVVLDSMRFWAWYPKNLTNGTRTFFTDADYTGKDTLSFGYTLPTGGQTSGSPAHACDATNQEDLLFAYNCRWYDPALGSSSEEVDLNFRHALSQINFIVYPKSHADQTAEDGSLRKDYQIVEISLQNIADTARCTIKGKPEGKTPNADFTWDKHYGKGTYTQYYGADFSSATPESAPSGWKYKDYVDESNHLAHFYCNNCFFIIPENIGDATSVSVTFQDTTIQANKVTKLAKLKGVGTYRKGAAPVTEWLPGYRYTYRLAISGDITAQLDFSVELEDWVPVNDSMRF